MTNNVLTQVKELTELVWVNFTVGLHNLGEFVKVMFRYYSNLKFMKIDLALRGMYLFHNPFTISKRFLIKQGEEDVYAYGETPLTTLEKIAEECQIKATDVVYELGAGRGYVCFWLNCFIGCRVVGIECIPEFVERAQRVQKRLGVPDVEFRLGDFCRSDLSGATVIYLYGTCLQEDAIKSLIQNLSKLPAGTKIITVSYPLSDYTEEPLFEVMKRFSCQFTWGEGDVYLQMKS